MKEVNIDCSTQENRKQGFEFINRLNSALLHGGSPYTVHQSERDENGETTVTIRISQGNVFEPNDESIESEEATAVLSVQAVPEDSDLPPVQINTDTVDLAEASEEHDELSAEEASEPKKDV